MPQLLRTKVFISYSHQDHEWLKRLRVHLRPLEREYDVEIWDDSRIAAGAKWRDEIARTIETTKVAVLLVSADFLGSDFIASDELPPLLKAAEEEGALILPVILSPSRFSKTKTLADFQAVNPPSKPLIDMPKGEQEAVFVKVAEIIEGTLAVAGGKTATSGTSTRPEPDPPRAAEAQPRETPAVVRQLMDEMHALFEAVHQEYTSSFRRYRELIKNTRGAIGADHPVVDAIRADHVFTGGPRAKLLEMTQVAKPASGGAVENFCSAVERYLNGIRRKETYFQLPNAPRMDFLRELERTFGATPEQHAIELGLLKKNARYQERARKVDPQNPLLALLDGNGKVTKEQSRQIKEYQILATLDAIVERTQAQYAKVNREYLVARKELGAG